MNTDKALPSGNDDVVFDNRNKSYGAYSIRKSYASSLTRGSGGSLLVAGFFIAVVQAALMMKPDIVKPILPKPPTIDLMDVHVVPDYREPPPEKEVRRAQGFPTTVVAHEVDETPITELNIPASPGDIIEGGDPAPSEGTGAQGNVSSEPVVVETPKTVDLAEVMPEFEGGTKAMYKFLRKHLHYPHTDQQGTVYVRFIIDITGTVTGVEVIRGVSGLLDKEAARVIAIMPKWKPGAQHGAPVNVRMILPIKFEMGKE
ncbi:MAG TPA: energy transducer TonB [Cyclobacteriaceae bacterium]|jgi:protein TonB|nr:energy transducer TonB [Cyclobacteriaceae bacterium]